MPVDSSRRASWWPIVAALGGIAVTVALGYWQLGRAGEKRELKARFEAQAALPAISVGGSEITVTAVELRRVEARGIFDARYAVFIDNRIHRSIPGYHVVMPLHIEGTDRYVLVNRGWVPQPPLRDRLPDIRTPREQVSIVGVALVPGQQVLELSSSVIAGRVWQNLTIERYRQAMPIAVQPFLIRQDNVLDDGLVREWPAPDFGIQKHYGYAFQWFALALTIVLFYAITRYRRSAAAAP